MSETESHPLKHWLDKIAAAQPESPAIYIEDEEISYLILKDQVEALVTTLTQAGIKMGSHLALVTRSARIVALVAYAAPHMGITFLPLDPNLPEKWQASLLQQAGIEYVLCDNEISEDWSPDVNVITIGQLLLQQFTLGGISVEPRTSIYTPLMLATSGSTDVPKVVLLSPENITTSVQSANHYLQLQQNDLWLNCMPLFHIAGLMILYRSIACGAAVILHDKFNAKKVWHDLQKYPVSHISLVPTMLQRLLDVAGERSPPASLRLVIIGGATLEPALAQRALKAGWPLYMSYGMTETSSQIAGCRLNAETWNEPFVLEVYAGIETQIRGIEESTDGSGQLALRGAAIMSGYADSQNLSTQALDADGWLLTRDIAKLNDAGHIIILGRADDVIISGGENIHPAQVEAIMRDCPGIDEIAITSNDNPEWGQSLVAIYRGTGSKEKIEQWSRDKLKGSWRPRQFIKIDALPRLPNGKLDRQSLSSSI
ncbi:O-succinylbenzoic acid--CoA ligase [hydrothermal vent metagenome]|uniref:O-succinylbenzoic acid--CoA ligase n=1 Tax=hydrothermal vent metagenome TaxID=652676 RepID=A0A3B1BMG4_9ZZZZ